MNHDKDKAGRIPRIAILGIHLEANGPMVRRMVGPGVPVIVTHDLHCNVSERLVDAVDALIASHIDLGWCDNYKKYLFNFAKHRRPEHYGLIVERTGAGASISRKKTP